MSIRLVHPCPQGRPTDAFGWRAAIPGVVRAQLHTGQDWAAPEGTPVRAMHSGRVNRIWWDTFADGSPAGGNMLQIGAAQCSSRYAHLSGYAVSAGDEVQAGQIIGYVGRTGAATGNHLHAELLLAGQFVDPMPYITSTPQPRPKADEMSSEPDSMFAVVDGVPSWCWINWGAGTVFSVHTQAEADWIGKYMGSVKFNWAGNPLGSDLYKNKLALLGLLAPKAQVVSANLTPEERARVEAMIRAGAAAAVAGAAS